MSVVPEPTAEIIAEEIASIEEEAAPIEEEAAPTEEDVAPIEEEAAPIEDKTTNDIIYVKDDIDLGEFVVDFLKNEEFYYSYIHSFSNENTTILQITDDSGKRISSAILLKNDTVVLEVKRFNTENFEREVHNSILQWYTSVCGEDSPFTELFDSILIGKNSVPLWNVLKVVCDDDNLESQKDNEDNEDNKENPMPLAISILIALFIVYLMLIYYIIDI